MFSAVRRQLFCLTLGLYSAVTVSAPLPQTGQVAEQQTRYIASHFPGRMTGSPAELLAAEYVKQQFQAWGYQSDIRQFTARYPFAQSDGEQIWHSVTGNSVIAFHQGSEPQQIIIMAHLDTYTPQSDQNNNDNLGGLFLQGVDDNASGLGVMLELAEKLRNIPVRYSIRFIATSGKQIDAAGARSILLRMTKKEQKDTLLVINLDSLIIGDKLAFISSASTPNAVRKLGRDRAVALAHQFAIPVATKSAAETSASKGNDFYQDVALFDSIGIPVLSVESTQSGRVSHSSHQQRPRSKAFPEGTVRYQVARDNIQYLDKWLPGQITKRSHDAVKIMLPLIKELAKAGPLKHKESPVKASQG